MFSMAHLTRQLARITVSPLPRAAIIKSAVAAPTRAALGPQLLAGFDYLTIQNRGFARGSRKDIDEKNAKRLRIQNKKKKNTPKPVRRHLLQNPNSTPFS